MHVLCYVAFSIRHSIIARCLRNERFEVHDIPVLILTNIAMMLSSTTFRLFIFIYCLHREANLSKTEYLSTVISVVWRVRGYTTSSYGQCLSKVTPPSPPNRENDGRTVVYNSRTACDPVCQHETSKMWRQTKTSIWLPVSQSMWITS